MVRTKFVLGLSLLFLVNPLILAEATVNGNVSVESTTYNDDTRRDKPEHHTVESRNVSDLLEIIKHENVKGNKTVTPIADTYPALPEEITDFHINVPCDNAQFLLKILSVILPLLRNEVPQSSRTSYILVILKDLLKTSPEAAEDNEIKNKINDLIVSLDKYNHDAINYEHISALRRLSKPVNIPDGVEAKMVFKYEVPQIPNSKCMAELLTIIKVVQQAILRLVNNPLCKSQEPIELPFYVDFGTDFEKPELYSHLPDLKREHVVNNIYLQDNVEKVINNLPPYLHDREDYMIPKEPQKNVYPYFDIDLPQDELRPNSHMSSNENPYYNFDNLPAQQRYPSHASDRYLDYPNDEYVNYPYSTYRPAYEPTNPSKIIPSDDYDEQKYSPNIPKQPQYEINELQRPSPINFYGEGNSAYVPLHDPYTIYNTTSSPLEFLLPTINNDVIINTPNFDKLKNQPSENGDSKKDWILPFNLPSTIPSQFDVYGDYNSGDIFTEHKPNQPWLDITGSPGSSYVSIGSQYPENPDIYLIHPEQKPTMSPKYDSAGAARPTIIGVPDSKNIPFKSRPNQPFLVNDIPSYDESPDINEQLQQRPAFEVAGSGSGEIKLGSLISSPLSNTLEYHSPLIMENPTNIYDNFPNTYEPHPGFLNTHYKPSNWPEGDIYRENYQPTPKTTNQISSFWQEDEPTTKHLLIPDIDNQYVGNVLYEGINYPTELHHSEKNKPVVWDDSHHKNTPYTTQQPALTTDKNILLIIKDNIDVIIQKIPKYQFSPYLRDMIKKVKDLLDLEQFTVEKYVNIINQYQILIKYVKHLNISNAIMNDLLLSMTNLDKLNLHTGKSDDIELTYLVKRPQPLIYQPYYYIKYRLPYTSFLTRVERLLAANPHLTQYPDKLYKTLVLLSEVAETSPDLEGYGKDDIVRLTFDNGALVGAKIVNGPKTDLYKTLDGLKELNSEYTVDDIYRLIKNLDVNLKHKSNGFSEKNGIPMNINEKHDEIRIQVYNKPLLEKISKITSNKVDADTIIQDILHKANYLRSNVTEHDVALNDISLTKTDSQMVNNSSNPVLRMHDEYDLHPQNSYFDEYNSIEPSKYLNDKIKSYDTHNYDKKLSSYDIPASYLYGLQNNVDHYSKNNDDTGLHSKVISETEWNPQLLPEQYSKLHSVKESRLLNPYDQNSKSQMSIPSDFVKSSKGYSYLADDSKTAETDSALNLLLQLNPITAAKLVEATFNSDKNYKNNDLASQKYTYESPITSISDNRIIKNPKILSEGFDHTKIYKDRIPIKHTKTYIIKKDNNLGSQYENSDINSVKYDNTGDSKMYADDNSYIDNYNSNIDPNQLHDLSTGPHFQNYDTDDLDNLAYNGDNLHNDKISPYISNIASSYNNYGNQDYSTGNTFINNNNLANNQGSYYESLNPNLTNNLMKTRYHRYVIQRWPTVFPLGRKPRITSHRFIG